MSNLLFRHLRYSILFISALLILTTLVPPAIHGEETNSGPTGPHPLLVRTRRGDTPETLAQSYLKDVSKGWMIREYNDIQAISGGEAVVVPRAPFRLGGLSPDGYQIVPVLVYTDMNDATGQKDRLSRSAFKDQMHWVKTRGFTTITPSQLVDFMAFSGQIPRQSVLITADTDSIAFYDQAAPVLKALGFTATVFVAAEQVGGQGAMTWNQLKQLRNAGFSIGCRGRYGRSLTRRKKGQSFETNFKWIESDLRQAKKEIETQLGEPCLFLAYPQGRTNNLISAMAANIGFSAAFSLSPGGTSFFANRFGIHRTPIDIQMNQDRFGNLLTTTIAADLN